jgi:hypothetical protein
VAKMVERLGKVPRRLRGLTRGEGYESYYWDAEG